MAAIGANESQIRTRPETGTVTIQPLPVPTRIFDGEGLISYAARHAARNGTTVQAIEKAVHEARTIPKPSHRRTPERLQSWRDLGALHESAFTTPALIDGADVIDRELCLRCTCGAEGKKHDCSPIPMYCLDNH